MFEEYPTANEIQDIYCNQMHFDAIDIQVDFFKTAPRFGDLRDLRIHIEKIVINEYTRHFHNHYRKTLIAYTFSKFYFDKGLPHQFAEYTDLDHTRRLGFEYHSDLFFYKLFSTLDMIGHILNRRFRFDLPQRSVSFKEINKQLEKRKKNSIDPALIKVADAIAFIIDSHSYKKADGYRNAVTHRNPPMHNTVSAEGNSVTVSAPNTITCFDVFSFMEGGLKVLDSSLLALKELATLDDWLHELS